MLFHVFAGLLGVAIVVAVVVDLFETIVLPRRVNRRFRLTRGLYRATWAPWKALARLSPRNPENLLSIFGPLGLLLLLATWAGGLILGFGLLQWANGSSLTAPEGRPSFGTDLYLSATSFLTLGLGDVAPRGGPARLFTALEAAGGFGVLALVIGYLPALYQAFARREIAVSLLDARAGSPPSAGELLRRYADLHSEHDLEPYLAEWETWESELLESHLSYPMLAYFRSQHDNQSWLASLTTILDACAFIIAALPDGPRRTAKLTFAMGRHAVVDLAQVLRTPPQPPTPERLTAHDLTGLCNLLRENGLTVTDSAAVAETLTKLRASYEPYVGALAAHLALPLPPWLLAREEITEDWRSTAWEVRGQSLF